MADKSGLSTLSRNFCSLTKIENLPIGLEYFYCSSNQITKIENLPIGLQNFDYDYNHIKWVDNVEYEKIKFKLRGFLL